jgi:hypothetical protein
VQITRTTPLRRMILQFLQIFLTDALTFMSLLRMPLIHSAYLATLAVVTQVGFLHHALVLMAHRVRL